MSRLLRFGGAAVGLLAALTSSVGAQDYPSRPVQLVIPYVPGGATDVLARLVADSLGTRLGQRVVPDNKPGAGAVLATGQVAHATPDGYTLLFGTSSHAINATMNPQLPYDSINDFEFIGKIGQVSFIIVTSPQVKANDLKGLVELMRSQPSKLQFGSAGVGTPMHLGGELLKHLTKTDALHVPYRGETAALTDLLGGRLTFMLCSVPTCAPRLQDGTIKALAVTSDNRSPLAAAIPTASEAGVPGMATYSWFFIAAPKGTPDTVISKLDRALNEVLRDEKFASQAFAIGIEADARSSPNAVKALMRSEIDKWRPIIKSTGATN